MTVIRPNSISGVTSITALTQSIEFYKSDGSLSGANIDGISINTAGIITAAHFYGNGSILTGITGTTINNNAANRIITGEGGTTLNGEANLTYDGTTLNIIDSGGGSGSHRLTIGNSHDLRLYHDGNSTVGHYGDGDLYITSENGKDLYLRAADDILIKPQGGENGITVTGNGSVALYHNNVKALETKVNQSNTGSGVVINNPTGNGNRVLDVTHTSGDYAFCAFLDQNTTSNAHVRLGAYGNEMYIYAGGNHAVKIDSGGHFLPASNNTFDLGASTVRWRNVYTYDLNLSNKGSTNSIDNTWGDYTIQEGESDLFLINNRNGKKYKFNLTEVS